MGLDNQQETKLPAWMLDLLAQAANTPFLADDEALLLDCDAAEQDFICEEVIQPPVVELGEWAKVDLLDDTDCFADELVRLVGVKWPASKRALCEKALLLENTYYKIQAGRRLPGRDTIICLALTLKLEIPETQHLLGYLGYGLSDQFKRDYIILRCLELRKEPLEVNLLLEQCGLRLLGPNE